MKEARISEIFVSYQGEASYAGSRQLFVRFFGCNLKCSYCDTPQASYRTFSPGSLLGRVLEMGRYNELALTGGEPLLYAEFLKVFLGSYKGTSPGKVYLETNGILHAEFSEIKENIDVISMDIKLPSSSPGQREHYGEHADFIRACTGKKTVIKMVITSDTNIDDIKKAADLLGCADPLTEVFLQPVSVCNENIGPPDGEMLDYFKGYLTKNTDKHIAVTGQFHKLLGIR